MGVFVVSPLQKPVFSATTQCLVYSPPCLFFRIRRSAHAQSFVNERQQGVYGFSSDILHGLFSVA